ncbi:MAG: Uma2 family endonuclease [Planctomycetota bacterium]
MSDPAAEKAERFAATVEEYLEFEAAATEKHEWIDGYVRPLHRGPDGMAGGTIKHSWVSSNIVRELGIRVRPKGCAALTSDLRVRTPIFRKQQGRRGLYTYPDVTVLCGKPEIEKITKNTETLTNPTLLVEVLSPSTASDDFGEKFDRYGTIETFREYVLVDQAKPHVQVFFRRDDGDWKISFFTGLDAVARFESLDIELPLSEIYDGVEFDQS